MQRSLSRALCLALVIPAIGTSTRTVYADPTWMTATATMVHDGGFNTPATPIGPFDLPFDPAPEISIYSNIQDYQHGDPARQSQFWIGGSKYFDPTRAVVLLAPGSRLNQFADGQPANPATMTLDVTASARVDNWSPITGFFDVPLWASIGSGGFADYDVVATFNEYVGLANGTPTRQIAVNKTISQHLLFSTPGYSVGRLLRTIALPDVALTPAEVSAGRAGFIAFNIHAVVQVLDPDEQTDSSFQLNFGGDPVPAPGVLGDYNGNGAVDAGDYVSWRKGGPLQNDVATVGSVTQEDYDVWRTRFSNTTVAGSGDGLSAAVPEPSVASLLAVASFFLCGRLPIATARSAPNTAPRATPAPKCCPATTA